MVGGTWARSGLPPAESTWTYNAANQLTAWDQTTVTYDANGDLTQTSGQGTTVTYTWNSRHQLVGISGGGTTASFAYDGLGRRISKTVDSASTQFVYDGWNPVQELSGGSPVANLFTGLGIDEFISRTEGGTTSTFLTEGIGSTLALTDGTGTIQTEYSYEPFGLVTVAGTSSTNPFQFTGREHDGTGLVYYRARYYSPVIQRFISEDPIGFAGGDANLYAYVFNSPTNFTDPSGLFVYPGWPPPGGNSSKSGDSPPPPDPWDTIGFLPGGGAFGPGGLGAKGAAAAAAKAFQKAGQQLDRNGLTKAGRALQKHGDRPNSAFPKSTGTASERNQQGQQVLEDILNSSNRTSGPNKFGGTDIFDNNTGRGVRFNADGTMKGFLEP